jgi:hypothetical protein
MRSLVSLLFISILGLFSLPGKAQVDQEDRYEVETVFGITINTNSGLPGGFMFKHTRQLSESRYHSFGLELVDVRSQKETRYPTNNNNSNGTFTYDKLNNFFVVRPQYGREWVLFRKAPEEGVQINLLVAAGPSIGLLKPYYLQYTDSNTSTSPRDVSYQQLIDESGGINGVKYERIVGTRFWAGFDELKARIGGHVKAGLSFEFGAFRNSVTGFEVGLLLEAYSQKIPIMYRPENRSVFTSAYLTFFLGSKK